MINPVCTKCGTRPLFESEDRAFDAGWLKVGINAKEIWLCSEHKILLSDVLEAEQAVIYRRIQEA